MISYYELLGLIKEGKQPSEVKFRGDTYSWNGEYYKSDDYGDYLSAMFEIHMFNKNIEIIEDKPKKIEELPKWATNYDPSIEHTKQEHCNWIYGLKINELIDKINYLLKEDKHENIEE